VDTKKGFRAKEDAIRYILSGKKEIGAPYSVGRVKMTNWDRAEGGG